MFFLSSYRTYQGNLIGLEESNYLGTYRKEIISSNGLKNASHDIVVSHLAAFERLIDYGGRTIIKDYAASCVTLMSQDRVPPGINHNVIMLIRLLN